MSSSTEDEKTTSDGSVEAPAVAEEPKKEEKEAEKPPEEKDETAEIARAPSDTEVRFKAHAILNKVENAENKRLSSTDLKAKEEVAKKEEAAAAAAAEQAKLKKEQEIENKKKAASDTLTKRMQKLALDIQERQKNSSDRLRVIQSDQSSHLSSAKTFQDLNLPEHLIKAIFEMGFERPSAIQEEALPRILANPPRNLIGQAQSGSGKTAAFVLGMLFRINIDTPATCQGLCVTPTRELAVQIFNNAVTPMAAHMPGLKVRLALAGETIERGAKLDSHMVIGTPGKVVDWLKRRIIDARTIKVFVLDEADNMVAESGHRANSLLIKKVMPKKCQSLLFSATFPDEVISFAEKMIHNPDKILIESDEYLVLDIIKQIWIDCQQYDGGKLQFLEDIYSLLAVGKSIIFVGTKRDADSVHRTLADSGYSCSVLHSSVENEERDRTMEAFRKDESNVLITTNVLARGVDVDGVCLVVNYDVPIDKEGKPDFETYLHRIGRTGRFGRKGTAINLIGDQKSIEVLAAIEGHFSTGGKEMIAMAECDPEALADTIDIL
ncbi:ATP-dependent RNA helicase [Skeletonema marinoi]|uniref:RNA helicase n=1 Tax=Skeletonema marinoi TaxID=267567 RepID=A0AAD9D8D9_9STRA|nr:ATP-dependent RNA helicase [Skeletonema marinoi]